MSRGGWSARALVQGCQGLPVPQWVGMGEGRQGQRCLPQKQVDPLGSS